MITIVNVRFVEDAGTWFVLRLSGNKTKPCKWSSQEGILGCVLSACIIYAKITITPLV
jgi:hypothetical protein